MDCSKSSMYKIKPVFELNGDITTSNSMYKMKNLHSPSPENCPSMPENGTGDSILCEIESKQTEILRTLSQLKEKLASIKESLRKQCVTKPAVESSVKLKTSINEMFPELVLNASVHHPPYSLLGIKRIWGVSITLSCHVHSSLSDIPDNLRIFEKLTSQSNSNNAANIKIRLVWKELTSDCEFIVSPAKYIALQGEVNMLRFIHRHVSPSCDVLKEIQLDEKLDACFALKFCQSNKEILKILNSLMPETSKSLWICGNELSIVDIAAWSAIKSLKKPALSKKWTTWLQNCEKELGL